MFHLIPAPLHRAALRVAYRVRAKFRQRFRRPSFGVSLIARDAHGRVLLVRHSYGSGKWSVPGGGRSPRETPEDCVRREMREELRCEIAELEFVRVSHRELQGSPNVSHIFTGRLASEPKVDGREILAAQWFDPADLPTDIVRMARRQVDHVLAFKAKGAS